MRWRFVAEQVIHQLKMMNSMLNLRRVEEEGTGNERRKIRHGGRRETDLYMLSVLCDEAAK